MTIASHNYELPKKLFWGKSMPRSRLTTSLQNQWLLFVLFANQTEHNIKEKQAGLVSNRTSTTCSTEIKLSFVWIFEQVSFVCCEGCNDTYCWSRKVWFCTISQKIRKERFIALHDKQYVRAAKIYCQVVLGVWAGFHGVGVIKNVHMSLFSGLKFGAFQRILAFRKNCENRSNMVTSCRKLDGKGAKHSKIYANSGALSKNFQWTSTNFVTLIFEGVFSQKSLNFCWWLSHTSTRLLREEHMCKYQVLLWKRLLAFMIIRHQRRIFRNANFSIHIFVCANLKIIVGSKPQNHWS